MRTQFTKFAMVAVCSIAMGMVFAQAETAEQLQTRINDYGFMAEINGNAVIVTGTVIYPSVALTLNTDAGVNVIWEAEITGNVVYGVGLVYKTGAGSLEVKSGKIEQHVEGSALKINGGSVLVSGGEISSWDGDGVHIDNGTVNITGGAISTTWDAVSNYAYGTVSISGGTISTTNSSAVYTGSGTTTLTGGFLLAYKANADEVMGGSAYDNSSGNAVISAWNQAAGKTEYTAGTSEDIVSLPAKAAVWANRGKAGILANNGGFIAIDGVEVIGSSPIRPPQIANASGNHATQVGSTINLTVKNNAAIEIYGLKGNLISRQNYASGSHTVSLKHLSKGMYIVKVSFGSGTPAKILRATVAH
jgi:hypothetical protein